MTAATPGSKQLLKQARSFHTKKNLGQHFLVNADSLNAIVESLELSDQDEVVEIGPGIGFLTRLLCSKAGEVTAIELDRESIDYLKSLSLPKLNIKHGDFLSYDINSGRFREPGSQAWEESKKEKKLKVVGNVPYQITGLILGHLLGEIGQPSSHLCRIDRIVLTIQKEVAERMVAKPGTKQYAQLSLLISYFCRAEIVQNLPASDFFPPPRVDSAVVKLLPLGESNLQCKNHRFLRRVIRAGFAQRRKMLRNALCSLGIDQEDLNRVFKELRFDPQIRAETLSLQQFAMLTDALEPLVATNSLLSNENCKEEIQID